MDSEGMKLFGELTDLVANLKIDMEKFERGKNKYAANLRETTQDIRAKAVDIRKYISEVIKARKEAKEAAKAK